jgi:hypothetical protein
VRPGLADDDLHRIDDAAILDHVKPGRGGIDHHIFVLERLGRWMLGRDPEAASDAPEQNVPLPTPVPIYVTYLTAQAHDGQLSFVDDIYGRDAQAMQVAALR